MSSLVAYFSATGTTARAATRLAQAIGADLFEIVPERPYSAADLNWSDKSSRSSVEMADESCRPAIASLGRAPQRMAELAPGARVAEGRMLNGNPGLDELRDWAASL